MSYHVIDPSEVEPLANPDRELRPIGRAFGFETLGLNHFEADPGGQIPLEYHSHEQQEEAFFVVDGTIHVETPAETFVVDAGQYVGIEPGNPHRAYVPDDADGPATVVAVGAPQVDDVQVYDP